MRRIGVGLEAIKSSIFRTFVAVERLRTPPGGISDPDFVIAVLARLNYGYSAAWCRNIVMTWYFLGINSFQKVTFSVVTSLYAYSEKQPE